MPEVGMALTVQSGRLQNQQNADSVASIAGTRCKIGTRIACFLKVVRKQNHSMSSFSCACPLLSHVAAQRDLSPRSG